MTPNHISGLTSIYTFNAKHNLSLLLVVLLVSACGQSGSSTILRIPVYQECLEQAYSLASQIDREMKKQSGHVSLTIELFDQKSAAHPTIAGSALFEGRGPYSDFNSLDIYVNTFKHICFPQTLFEIENSDKGMQYTLKEIERNKGIGIPNNYVTLDEKNIQLYFNSRDYESEEERNVQYRKYLGSIGSD